MERLVRVRIGPVRLGELPPGELRELTAQERDRLASDLGAARAARGRVERRPAPGRDAATAHRWPSTGRVRAASPRSAPGPRHVLAIASATPGSCIAASPGWPPTGGWTPRTCAGLRPARPGRWSWWTTARAASAGCWSTASDVTDSLHAAAVDRIVSAVARVPEVRGALLRRPAGHRPCAAPRPASSWPAGTSAAWSCRTRT